MRTAFNPMGNINMAKDYIIDYGNNEDKSQWYRLWKSGWIEQGGKFNGSADITYTIPFIIPFTEIPVIVTSNVGALNSTASLYFRNQGGNTTTTNFKFHGWCPIAWYACGY